MHYVIYDLEFNQKTSITDENQLINNTDFPFEIIQIGAIMIDENFKQIATFNKLIKPTAYTTIHPYVESLTKITDQKLFYCQTFPEVFKEFIKFLGDDQIVFCVWGKNDIKELLRNIKFHNLPTIDIFKYYIDIQQHASKIFNVPKGTKIGLSNAVNLLNITTNSEFHDAYNDAFYTAEVFKTIYNVKMKPKIYKYTPSKRLSKPKEKTDTVALIAQFEKMLNRTMTKEEMMIIKLAYNMGKTKQFIKK